MRAFDGRGPATRLTAEILSHFNVDDESRLPGIVYDREQPIIKKLRRVDELAAK
jgi:N-acetylglucosamine kinase-like BadF-type ATPase